MKRTPPPPKSLDIPSWFVTYTDVITLLMTFFILLLTFANKEPENFQLIQRSLFGEGGGNLGRSNEALDLTSVVMRVRTPSSRITSRGSEIPPMYTDPITEAVGTGLASLDEISETGSLRSFSFNISRDLFFDSDGQLTELARRHLALLAGQLIKLPMTLTIDASTTENLDDIAKLATHLVTTEGAAPDRVGIGMIAPNDLGPHQLRLVLGYQSGH